jgi:hypothetical protein
LEHINWQRQLSKMSNTGNDNYLIFIFEFFSPAYPYEKQNRREIYKNFTTFTVTIPLVLPIGTKDSEKFTKISQHSQ